MSYAKVITSLPLVLLFVLLTACGQPQAAAPATPTIPEASPMTPPEVTIIPDGTDSVSRSATEAAGVDRVRGELLVFAAASLTNAFTDLGDAFATAYPGTNVRFNFSNGQQLVQQIDQGAPCDIFAAASIKHMQDAFLTERVTEGTERIFARNRLVVIMPSDNPAQITTLQDLARPGLKIAFGDKATSVGQLSLTYLDKAEQDASLGAAYKEAVLANIVSYEETVRAVLTKVALGEVDAGIVFVSDISQDDANRVQSIDIPDALNTVVDYPIAMINDTDKAELAQAFIDYVLSADGQAILATYGFISVQD